MELGIWYFLRCVSCTRAVSQLVCYTATQNTVIQSNGTLGGGVLVAGAQASPSLSQSSTKM